MAAGVVDGDALEESGRQRAHQADLDLLAGVEDQHVLALPVGDERQSAVGREGERARAGDDVVEGAGAAGVVDGRKVEARAGAGALGIERRQRREDGRLEVERRLRRADGEEQMRCPQHARRRIGHDRVDAAHDPLRQRLGLALGRFGKLDLGLDREAGEVDGGDAGAEQQVRDEQRSAVGADAGAPRMLVDGEGAEDDVLFGIDLGHQRGLVADHVDRRAVGGGDHADRRRRDGNGGEHAARRDVEDEDGVGGLAGDVHFGVAAHNGERARRDGGLVATGVVDRRRRRERDFGERGARRRVDDSHRVGVGVDDPQRAIVAGERDGRRRGRPVLDRGAAAAGDEQQKSERLQRHDQGPIVEQVGSAKQLRRCGAGNDEPNWSRSIVGWVRAAKGVLRSAEATRRPRTRRDFRQRHAHASPLSPYG